MGGQRDLNNKYLTTVGRAQERFGEDALRMLRAVRFVGQLGFTLDPAARAAIDTLAERVRLVSIERVRAEIERLLITPYLSSALELLGKSALGQIVWPELEDSDYSMAADFTAFAKWEHAFAVLTLRTTNDPTIRLKAWKVSGRAEKLCVELVRTIRSWRAGELSFAGRMRAWGGGFGEDLRAVLSYLPDDYVPDLSSVQSRLAEMGGCLPKSFLNGKDLLTAGFSAGASMGRILEKIYEEQLEGKVVSREQAIERAQNLKGIF